MSIGQRAYGGTEQTERLYMETIHRIESYDRAVNRVQDGLDRRVLSRSWQDEMDARTDRLEKAFHDLREHYDRLDRHRDSLERREVDDSRVCMVENAIGLLELMEESPGRFYEGLFAEDEGMAYWFQE